MNLILNCIYFILIILILPKRNYANCEPKKKVVMCYWSSWSVYRPGLGVHKADLIEPEYCTHLVYAFAGLNKNGELDTLDYHSDITLGMYKKFIEHKESYPCVKFMLAFGGWNEGSEKYSYMAETEERRQKFVDSVMRFIIHYDFDGIDVDWSYPANRNGLPEDRDNYIKLLKLLWQELKHRDRILTAAVSASQYIIRTAYNITEMCRYLDYANIMAYDMQMNDRTSAHAPLRRERTEVAYRETIDTVIQMYTKNGCPAEKLVLGIPAYGRTVTLKSTYTTVIGSPVTGPGAAAPISQTPGFMGFNEICTNSTTANGWRIYYLPENAAKYAYKGNQWVSYDDPDTVKQKAKYVVENRMAGIMLWSIDTDDFRGNCYSESYPLLVAANKGLGNKIF